MPNNNTLFIPFGHRCSAAALLDRCQLGGESFPFDSVVSKLNVIRHFLEQDFKDFLNPNHYVKVKTATINLIDDVAEAVLTEFPSVNRYLERASRPVGDDDLTGASTYHLQFALTHHDPTSPDDCQAFARRIQRLRHVLSQTRKKVGFYIHPLIGIRDYERQRRELVAEFKAFTAFLTRRYPNVFGLYFIPVKAGAATPPETSTLIFHSETCAIYTFYVNDQFLDANAPFFGDHDKELQAMIAIVRRAEFSAPPRYKIYFPTFDHVEADSNEMRLTREGLLAHPQITLVDRPEIADYLLFCQNHLVQHNPHHKRFGSIKDRYKDRCIMLDYGDDPGSLIDAEDFRWRLYFKRSVVDREHGRVVSYGGRAVRTTAYCVIDDMCAVPDGDDHRPIDVACLFEDAVIDTPHFALARGRLLKFAKRFAETNPGLAMQIGTVSECGPIGRSKIDPSYKRCLYASKIILHANPDFWEGDARLWEALASGALVFVDRLCAPIQHPLIDGEHLVFYDLGDEGLERLGQRLLHYLADDAERARIGHQGRQFALEHHRSVNRICEIVDALETTADAPAPTSAPVGPSVGSQPDIIVSIATGYSNVDEYRPFISSLRRTGATCPVFVGISDGPEYGAVKRFLLENGVNYFIVPPLSPPNKVVNGYRFALYRDWLADLDFRYALLLDLRDVYFQRDPFSDIDLFMHDCDLYLMSEFQLLTLGNHPNGMNYAWIAEPFGTDVADAMADRPILNCGAILGRKTAIMKLLDAYTEVTSAQGFRYVDQGTLNYLAYTGRLDHCGRVKTERAGVSLVSNCGFSELDLLRETRTITTKDEAQIAFIPRTAQGRLKLYRDEEGLVLDDDGSVAYVVHQYDRFLPEMDDIVTRLSTYECPNRVFVNNGNRPYRGEKYTLSSRTGLKPGAVKWLIDRIASLPTDHKPLLILDAGLRRGFVFAYGILNVDLLFAGPAHRRSFFDPAHNQQDRLAFLQRMNYRIHHVNEGDIFLGPEPQPLRPAEISRNFSEARTVAERWLAP